MEFQVNDTGKGIKEEDLPKIFTEYSQVHLKGEYPIEGTGLGLSICKSLIEMMDGTISVESEFGVGSTFTVKIVQKIIDPTPIDQETIQNLKSFQLYQNRHQTNKRLIYTYMPYGNVLIVDDVLTNLDVAEGLLTPYGLMTKCVTSGLEAFNIIKNSSIKFDLIFMDHMMPGMDGIETVKKIRTEINNDYAKNIPIIALTANAIVGTEEMFFNNGFQGFIAKPIDILKLDNILNRFILEKQNEETKDNAKNLRQQLINAQNSDQSDNDSSKICNWHIEGLDVAEGLKRYNYREDLFRTLLVSYVKYTPQLLSQIKEITSENLQNYRIIVHGLKGSSNGIAARKIGQIAERLEMYAKNLELFSVQKENPTLLKACEDLIEDLSFHLKNNPTGSSQKKDEKEMPDANILKEILNSCQQYKTLEIKKNIMDLEKYSYIKDEELVVWLHKQLDELEYDQIKERLTNYLDNLEALNK
jgi:CheY-like chemotaxis protein